jgi:hypothetical protein
MSIEGLIAKLDGEVKQKTLSLVIGKKYFLSTFEDVEGAYVKVLSFSTKPNPAGWSSSVEYEVIEPVGTSKTHSFHFKYYAAGQKGTCNVSNLYEFKELAKRMEVN